MVRTGTLVRDAIRTMSDKRLGMTCVADADGRLCGIITDGDLRRALTRADNLATLRVEDAMTAKPATIARGELAAAALSHMESRRITSLVVTDPSGRIEGVLHIHDLWRTQLF